MPDRLTDAQPNDPRVCTICGEREPFHVHDGDRRIEDYFTVGRGMSEMDAARAWQARALAAERSLAALSREDEGKLLDILEGERDRAEDRYERESAEWREERESMLAALAAPREDEGLRDYDVLRLALLAGEGFEFPVADLIERGLAMRGQYPAGDEYTCPSGHGNAILDEALAYPSKPREILAAIAAFTAGAIPPDSEGRLRVIHEMDDLARAALATAPVASREVGGHIEWWDDPNADVEGAKGFNRRYFRHVGCDEGNAPWVVPKDDCPPPKGTRECARCDLVVPLLEKASEDG